MLNEVDFADAHWNEVHKGMVTKVSAFDGFPYDYARKTGTSEQGTGPNKKENGVFIAFAPRDNPKLAVAVVVPEGGFGSVSASPIARKISMHMMKCMVSMERRKVRKTKGKTKSNAKEPRGS